MPLWLEIIGWAFVGYVAGVVVLLALLGLFIFREFTDF